MCGWKKIRINEYEYEKEATILKPNERQQIVFKFVDWLTVFFTSYRRNDAHQEFTFNQISKLI